MPGNTTSKIIGFYLIMVSAPLYAENSILNGELRKFIETSYSDLPVVVSEGMLIAKASVVNERAIFEVVLDNKNNIPKEAIKDVHRGEINSLFLFANDLCSSARSHKLLSQNAVFEYKVNWGKTHNPLYTNTITLKECDYVEKNTNALMLDLATSFPSSTSSRVHIDDETMYIRELISETEEHAIEIKKAMLDKHSQEFITMLCTDMAYAAIIYRGGVFIVDHVLAKDKSVIRHTEINIDTCEKLRLN